MIFNQFYSIVKAIRNSATEIIATLGLMVGTLLLLSSLQYILQANLQAGILVQLLSAHGIIDARDIKMIYRHIPPLKDSIIRSLLQLFLIAN